MPELPLSEKFVALVEHGRDLLSKGEWNPDAGQISPHQIRVYEAVRCSPHWMTAREISAVAADVAERTANRHARRLADFGVFERHRDLQGGYRYRLCATPDVAAQPYITRLETAKDVLGAKHERWRKET
ncbi:hypothetical protein [Paraburkholderia hospita]|uniref:hypothetical protein n=1 Tax=Paraburkholderia hospita TaxID=169430 RepID=UPI000271BFE9|nr:hypothetical protein [Paraburkholderia hospita]EUC21460.1 hypothetical protein PMI06_009176 [Burkholderia sp. BT03]SKC95341.1 hypothetical protein SAMN06266956_6909 [Paraburkholderia hospita]